MNKEISVLLALVLIVLLCASCAETPAPAALPTTTPLPSPTISPIPTSTQDCFLDIEAVIITDGYLLEETIEIEIGGKAGLELEYNVLAVSVLVEISPYQVDITSCLLLPEREIECEKQSIEENKGLLGKVIKVTVSITGKEEAQLCLIYLRVVSPSPDLPSA